MLAHEFHELKAQNDAKPLQPSYSASCCTPSKTFRKTLPIFAVIFKAISSALTTRFVWIKVSRETGDWIPLPLIYAATAISGISSLFNRLTNLLCFDKELMFPDIFKEKQQRITSSPFCNSALFINFAFQFLYQFTLIPMSSTILILDFIKTSWDLKSINNINIYFGSVFFILGFANTHQFYRNVILKLPSQMNALRKQYNRFTGTTQFLYSILSLLSIVAYGIPAFYIIHATSSTFINYFSHQFNFRKLNINDAHNIDLATGIFATFSGVLITISRVSVIGRLIEGKASRQIRSYFLHHFPWLITAACITSTTFMVNLFTTLIQSLDTFEPLPLNQTIQPVQYNQTNSTSTHAPLKPLKFFLSRSWKTLLLSCGFSLLLAIIKGLNDFLLNGLPDINRAADIWKQKITEHDTNLENMNVRLNDGGRKLVTSQILPPAFFGKNYGHTKDDAHFEYDTKKTLAHYTRIKNQPGFNTIV